MRRVRYALNNERGVNAITNYVTGNTIKTLREKKGYTQRQLADILCVSDKAVSKWETQKGLPDISLLEPLAAALCVSIAELLSGECIINANKAGNLARSGFYVCPVCGNVIFSVGKGSFSCCGVSLPQLEAEEADLQHAIKIENVENEIYVTLDHPMEKTHYISFIACVTSDKIQLQKMYPEQNSEARFFKRGRATIYAFCNRHGIFKK